MAELVQIEKKVKPHQVFFVCDAMTGQDAVASAEAFNEALELDGVILTKLDGDARGGAALSVRRVTGVPVKFVGKGEKLDQLEPFDPERLVGQMLGMGDIVGLVERPSEAVDEEEARRQQERLAKGKFDLNDFRKQIVQMKSMGSVRELMSMIPGLNQIPQDLGGIDADEEIKRIQGIIDSMTQAERSRPDLIDMSRRRRIAAGAGVDPSDVSGLVKQFDAMAAFVKSMSQMSMIDKIKALTGLGRAAANNPGARIFAPKVGTGKRLSPKEREKLRKQREKEERKRRREERDRPHLANRTATQRAHGMIQPDHARYGGLQGSAHANSGLPAAEWLQDPARRRGRASPVSHDLGPASKTLDNERRTRVVRIRMKSMGRRHRPFFRICAMDSRTPRDGRCIEELGHYDPMSSNAQTQTVLNVDRIRYWLGWAPSPPRRFRPCSEEARREEAGAGRALAVAQAGRCPGARRPRPPQPQPS